MPIQTIPAPFVGKTALITGGSRGIGAATALYLAQNGISNLILTYVSNSSRTKIEALRQKLNKLSPGINIHIVQNDISAIDAGEQMLVALRKDRIEQIDIIIHNAGVAGNAALGTEGISAAEFDRQYYTNVRGPLLLQNALLPYLPEDGSGRIVCLSSVSASVGLKEQSIYGGTKAALEAMVRSWAREFADRATVNAVNPGPVATDMYGGVSQEFVEHITPFLQTAPRMTNGRSAQPEEIASIIGMLCLPTSGWCTGSVVSCNGGLVMGH